MFDYKNLLFSEKEYIEKCVKKYEERKEKERIKFHNWFLKNRERHNEIQKKAYNKKHNNL